MLNNNSITFDEKTIIEKTKNNEKIYSFLGFFKDGKLIGDIFIIRWPIVALIIFYIVF